MPELIVEQVLLDAKGRATNLGDRPEDCIGREQEVEQIKTHLASECLITLTGTGGCGKTTVMREVGRNLLESGMDAFPEGVWFIELLPITPDAIKDKNKDKNKVENKDKTDKNVLKEVVAAHFLNTLGLRPNNGVSAHTALLKYVRNKRMLLLIDNCEHLGMVVPQLLSEINKNCPDVKLLVTTRVAHGIQWGRQINILPFEPLDPEAMPELSLALQNVDVRIFQHYRQKALTNFQVGEVELVSVALICYLLSGIPLALQLVACTRGNLEDIVSSLKMHWQTLPKGLEDADARHETMSHCILWSYDGLHPEEQALFRRLALFTGGWNLEMSHKVCTINSLKNANIFTLLNSL